MPGIGKTAPIPAQHSRRQSCNVHQGSCLRLVGGGAFDAALVRRTGRRKLAVSIDSHPGAGERKRNCDVGLSLLRPRLAAAHRRPAIFRTKLVDRIHHLFSEEPSIGLFRKNSKTNRSPLHDGGPPPQPGTPAETVREVRRAIKDVRSCPSRRFSQMPHPDGQSIEARRRHWSRQGLAGKSLSAQATQGVN